MSRLQKKIIIAVRIALGFLMAYAGLSHIADPNWSAAGYLMHTQTLPSVFHFFARPDILPLTNFANEWLLLLVGLSMMSGLFIGAFSVIGAILMALYYLPILHFPYVGNNAFLIDEHIIYILIFLFFAAKHLKLYETEHVRSRALRMAERGV
jgi:thiosulfate dehydrogenase (quinone) large subunit